jgi:LysM repeat protein
MVPVIVHLDWVRYNYYVPRQTSLPLFLILSLLTGFLSPVTGTHNDRTMLKPALGEVTAYDLIVAMNTLRVSYGHAALVEDPIINALAQATAATMAANHMSWHIGNVSGRLSSAGYGGGSKVWATENFAVGRSYSIDEIMIVWSDESHMLPAVNAAYCNVGAGVAKSDNGLTYYVLQAAYVGGKSCGSYTSPGTRPGNGGNAGGVSQLIVPVKIATPDKDGKIYHVVQAGQSLWAIAIAYKITIKDLETWNNISKDNKLQIGQKLFIPGGNTAGYATPTAVGMVQVSTPDPDGKIVHTVQAYQTLSTIAKAYSIKIDRILALNGIQLDQPLRIGQKLLINPGNKTPSPTLRAIEKLTPDSEGRYYHIVKSGETLSRIAALYEVSLDALMAWNGLNESSILYPEQKLFLQITPPATATFTPAPYTQTPTVTKLAPTSTFLATRKTTYSPTFTPIPPSGNGQTGAIWLIPISMAAAGVLMLFLWLRKR